MFEPCEPCRIEYAVTVFDIGGNGELSDQPLKEKFIEEWEQAGLQELWLSPLTYRNESLSLRFMPREGGEIGVLGSYKHISLQTTEGDIISYEQYHSPFTWLLQKTEQELLRSHGWYPKQEAISSHWGGVSGAVLSDQGADRYYVVRFRDRVVVIDDQLLTDEQIDRIVAVLFSK